MTAPSNITELRDGLAQLYNEAVEDKEKQHLARINAATNVAGKMISTVRTQIEYHAQRKEKPDIAFLNSEKGLPD